jgi:hypothetical protein
VYKVSLDHESLCGRKRKETKRMESSRNFHFVHLAFASSCLLSLSHHPMIDRNRLCKDTGNKTLPVGCAKRKGRCGMEFREALPALLRGSSSNFASFFQQFREALPAFLRASFASFRSSKALDRALPNPLEGRLDSKSNIDLSVGKKFSTCPR